MSRLAVAIDGPAGVGKSTAARRVAARLGVPYVDTGAMYRCLALTALRKGLDLDSPAAVESGVANAAIELQEAAAGAPELLLDGRPVGDAIRTEEVSRATSTISRYPGVRQRMVQLQRGFAGRHGGVLEGRDIGTVVLPNTPFKFFLDADPAVRADRRYRELRERGQAVTLAGVRDDLERRDRQDRQREDSPLRRDPSHTLIDTTHRSVDQVVEAIVEQVLARLKSAG